MERILATFTKGEWDYQAIEYTVDGKVQFGVRHMVRHHRVALFPATSAEAAVADAVKEAE